METQLWCKRGNNIPWLTYWWHIVVTLIGLLASGLPSHTIVELPIDSLQNNLLLKDIKKHYSQPVESNLKLTFSIHEKWNCKHIYPVCTMSWFRNWFWLTVTLHLSSVLFSFAQSQKTLSPQKNFFLIICFLSV